MFNLRFNPFAIPPLITGGIILLIAVTVFRKSYVYKTRITFSLFCLSMIVWLVCFGNMYLSPDKDTALRWARLGFAGITFIPILAYHFILSFLESKRKTLLILLYISAVPTLILSRTNYIYKGISTYFWGFYPAAGKFYFLDMLVFSGVFTWGVILLFMELQRAKKQGNAVRAQQLKYLLLAFACGTTGVTDYIIKFGISIYPYGYISALAFISIIAYAIVRYRLMDINIAMKNVLAYLAEAVILLLFMVIVLFISGLRHIFPAVICSAAITAGFRPLGRIIRRFIDTVIFKSKYNYREVLTKITDTAPTIIDQEKLIKYIVDNVSDCMRIKKAGILIKDERKDTYRLHYSVGLNGRGNNVRIEGNAPLIRLFKEKQDIAVRYELLHLLPHDTAESMLEGIASFDPELVIPLHKGKNLIGIFCLSRKGGGDIFNGDDFRILHTIANQTAVVIENIRLYDKLIHTDRQTFLETLSSGVSHEMRNRLVAIRTFIDLFPERVDTDKVDKGYIEFRDLAVREMGRLTKIIDGLLTYSRAVTIGGEPLNVNDLLDEAVLIIQPKLKAKEIAVKNSRGENIGSINGDKGRLLQVFINIMQNGVDAMDMHGELSIKTKDTGNNIEVTISDNGKGIPKDYIDAIFEPFFTTKHTGTGLGLSIVQRIIRDHNGTVQVKSKEGEGTSFNIIFSKDTEYKPAEILPAKGLSYWDVKKE